MAKQNPLRKQSSEADAAASKVRHEKRIESKHQVALWLDRSSHYPTLEKLAAALGTTRAHIAKIIVERALENIDKQTIGFFVCAGEAAAKSTAPKGRKIGLVVKFSELQQAVQVNLKDEFELRKDTWSTSIQHRENVIENREENVAVSTKPIETELSATRDITEQNSLEPPDLHDIARELGL